MNAWAVFSRSAGRIRPCPVIGRNAGELRRFELGGIVGCGLSETVPASERPHCLSHSSPGCR